MISALAPVRFETKEAGAMAFCRFFRAVRMKMKEKIWLFAHVAQLVERVLGKDEVISSILIMGSRTNC